MEKNAAKVIEGENLDILVGSIPLEDKEKDAVKEGIIGILKKAPMKWKKKILCQQN